MQMNLLNGTVVVWSRLADKSAVATIKRALRFLEAKVVKFAIRFLEAKQ